MKQSAVLIGIVLVALSMSDFGMAKTTSGSGGGSSGGSTRAAASSPPMNSGFASRSGGNTPGGNASGASAAGKSMGSGFSQSGGATSNAAASTSPPATKGPSFGSFGSDSGNAPHPSAARSSSASTRDLETSAAIWRALERYDERKGTPTAKDNTIEGRDLTRAGRAAAPAARPQTTDRAVNAQPRPETPQGAGDSTSNDVLWGVAAGYLWGRATTSDAGAHGGASQSSGAPGIASGDAPVTSNRAIPTTPIAQVGIAEPTNLISAVIKLFAVLGLFMATIACVWYFLAYVVPPTWPRIKRETKSTYSLK